ncbi:hypothetical protein RSOLAG1IB_12198 [Rhizoctonia solani AG-1 IB]|uniref:DUF659 domain-containing protein n=1 Tax=Thanatephorus cucumeris (strain AG1-IB / isolate 7/3/14) TaxID=1108050 RepID=A0A0B7FRJ3_THACB|nr:hypothetical protein RSOLAG1IB_12198 [Rhizoctonia solani AG-1 IB]
MSPAPHTPASPSSMTKSQLKKLNKLTDKQIWPMSDEVILAAALSPWTSYIYGHFKMFLERRTDEHGEQSLWFRFECKNDPILHTQYRARKDTSSGTHNLIRGAEACDLVRKVGQKSMVSTGEARKFSPTRLRALIALWCARNHRPFELFRDDLFTAIVDELRPGTSLPDPSTIGRDVRNIYFDNKDAIRQYFRQVNHVHLAMDGWTAPTSRSYLGVVAIWQLSGKLHRAILEFVFTRAIPGHTQALDKDDSGVVGWLCRTVPVVVHSYRDRSCCPPACPPGIVDTRCQDVPYAHWKVRSWFYRFTH